MTSLYHTDISSCNRLSVFSKKPHKSVRVSGKVSQSSLVSSDGGHPVQIAVPDPQLNCSIRFYCMGAVGMTREWVLDDNITSAETVVQMMFQSMPENMRSVLF